MFLFATLGFIIVQIDRQRKQRAQQVTGSRTEYLRYLSNIRKVAREAADQQRRALNWHHPDPAALPSLAEDRTRLWEHTASDPSFLHVRYGLCAQPLVARAGAAGERAGRPGRPGRRVGAAPAARRAPPAAQPAGVDRPARLRPDRAVRRRRGGPLGRCARAMICSATAFQTPEHLVVAVLSSEQNLAHWDWVKWLPHAQSAREADAVGPMRMVSTSLDDLGGAAARPT